MTKIINFFLALVVFAIFIVFWIFLVPLFLLLLFTGMGVGLCYWLILEYRDSKKPPS